jgi:hypothetical protein
MLGWSAGTTPSSTTTTQGCQRAGYHQADRDRDPVPFGFSRFLLWFGGFCSLLGFGRCFLLSRGGGLFNLHLDGRAVNLDFNRLLRIQRGIEDDSPQQKVNKRVFHLFSSLCVTVLIPYGRSSVREWEMKGQKSSLSRAAGGRRQDLDFNIGSLCLLSLSPNTGICEVKKGLAAVRRLSERVYGD